MTKWWTCPLTFTLGCFPTSLFWRTPLNCFYRARVWPLGFGGKFSAMLVSPWHAQWFLHICNTSQCLRSEQRWHEQTWHISGRLTNLIMVFREVPLSPDYPAVIPQEGLSDDNNEGKLIIPWKQSIKQTQGQPVNLGSLETSAFLGYSCPSTGSQLSPFFATHLVRGDVDPLPLSPPNRVGEDHGETLLASSRDGFLRTLGNCLVCPSNK